MSEQIPTTRDDPELAYAVGWDVHDEFVNCVDFRGNTRQTWTKWATDCIEEIANPSHTLDSEGQRRLQQRFKNYGNTAIMYAEVERAARKRLDWAIEQRTGMYRMMKSVTGSYGEFS